MTCAEFQGLLSRITYKEGWSLTFWINPGDEVIFAVRSSPTKDVDNIKGPLVRVSTFRNLGPLAELNNSSVLEWVRATIRDTELHELDEWLRLDGVKVRDPHASR